MAAIHPIFCGGQPCDPLGGSNEEFIQPSTCSLQFGTYFFASDLRGLFDAGAWNKGRIGLTGESWNGRPKWRRAPSRRAFGDRKREAVIHRACEGRCP